jgi:hypothetical protein
MKALEQIRISAAVSLILLTASPADWNKDEEFWLLGYNAM